MATDVSRADLDSGRVGCTSQGDVDGNFTAIGYTIQRSQP
ncbi:MAG: hypothetical protein JWM11_2560 [Planctomycetaceae bacterium]|nr:hypothetical protein [Planctomycetaceae bacterium]